ncbi:MAG: hypothetical protein SWY16_08190 [Cyanobacteriota bacterium]|nr:hypothetical protein [Cyanobacteriota bacterium]
MKFSPLSLTLTIASLVLLAADLATPGYGEVLGKIEAERFATDLIEGRTEVFATEPPPSEASPTAVPNEFNDSEGATLVDWNHTRETY